MGTHVIFRGAWTGCSHCRYVMRHSSWSSGELNWIHKKNEVLVTEGFSVLLAQGPEAEYQKKVEQICREQSKGMADHRLWWIPCDLECPSGEQTACWKLSSDSEINYGKSNLPCIVQEINMKNLVFLMHWYEREVVRGPMGQVWGQMLFCCTAFLKQGAEQVRVPCSCFPSTWGGTGLSDAGTRHCVPRHLGGWVDGHPGSPHQPTTGMQVPRAVMLVAMSFAGCERFKGIFHPSF